MPTLKLKPTEIKKFIEAYSKFEVENNNPNALAMFKFTGCTITVFKTEKILFQGPNAEKSASKWGYKSKVVKQNKFKSYIGSDEVGTGDFFGPIVVVAVFVDEKISGKLRNLGVDDSKKFNDAQIIILAEEIKKNVEWEFSIIQNKEYNKVIQKMNMNKIKAILHNSALIKLSKRVNNEGVVVDEFASEKNYFKYLEDTNNVIEKITFVQKAESKYIAVAAASIIARSIFLEEINKLSEMVDFKIQLGAGVRVDEQILQLNDNKLKKVGKLNFRNYTKIK